MLVSNQFLQRCQISKESEGGRGKNGQKFVDLTWNDSDLNTEAASCHRFTYRNWFDDPEFLCAKRSELTSLCLLFYSFINGSHICWMIEKPTNHATL